MKVCVNCDSPYVEPRGYCESDRCSREEAEYERFCQFNGDHCFDCFKEASLTGGLIRRGTQPFPDDPQPCLDAPVCPNCHSSEQVAPMQEGIETIGWMCKVCAWTRLDCE